MNEVLDALRWPAVAFLVCLSALFAGLTLGMLSLDKIELEVISAGEDKLLAACAAKIIPVRKNGNLLLCTFLVGNTACNSLSSILLADLEGGTVGFIISTVSILLFAEIIPQAVCSRYALQIGARVIFLVKFFIVILYPIAKPISMLLDCSLGEEIGTIHTRQELSKLLQIHVNEGAIDHESGNILQGTLRTMNMMKVTEILTKVDDCYMLHVSATLDFKTVTEIFEYGFSRIPVYDKNKSDVVAILFVKDLILVDPDDETPLQYFISIFGRAVDTFVDSTSVHAIERGPRTSRPG
jgi:metal transporter CNNM